MTRLSITSALVLLWAGEECFETPAARAYLKKIDVKPGAHLREQCENIWPDYGEVIKNRKFGVKSLMNGCAAADKKLAQVVIAGAGVEPLSVEWKALHPSHRVFDLDWENMETKREIVQSLGEKKLSDISFLTVDLSTAADIRGTLLAAGWDPEAPTIVVLEGVSCYLPPQTTRSMVALFHNAEGRSRAVLEYVTPHASVEADRRKIPEAIFGLVARHCGLDAFTHLTADDIGKWKEARLMKRLSMREMEATRTGANRFFPRDESGWNEVVLLAV